MAPPPITPSPHRFLSRAKARPAPKPPSSLREHHRPKTPPPQFAPTPKFSLRSCSSLEDVRDSGPSSPLVARQRRPAFKVQREEIVDDEYDEEDGGETNQSATATNRNDTKISPTHPDPPSPRLLKRRRFPPPTTHHEAITISDDEAYSSSSSTDSDINPASPTRNPALLPSNNASAHSAPPPSNPAFLSTITSHPPRFHIHPSIPPQTPAPRPNYILPPSLPPPAPIPAAFSPNRRGAKYVAGGLAATVREWVLAAGAQPRLSSLGSEPGGEWAARIKVEEVREGEGMVLLRGREEGFGGKEGRWVLVGQGEEVRRGELVGVKMPVWEVGVGGEGWEVSVDWRVLGEGRGRGK